MKVIVQKWEESERGWGVRPDGYSLHLTEEARGAYIQAHWDSLPDDPPLEYSRPSGSPYEAEVPSETAIGPDGLRFYDNNYPGDGGPNGWMPVKRSEDRNGG